MLSKSHTVILYSHCLKTVVPLTAFHAYIDGFCVIGIITGNFTLLVLIEPKNSCHLLITFAYCCEHKLASYCKIMGQKCSLQQYTMV